MKEVKAMQDEKVKTLANDIIEKCHQQGLTYSQVWELLTVLQARHSDALTSLQKQVANTTAELKYF